MNILLDTHTLLWQLDGNTRALGPHTTALLRTNPVHVSSISFVELHIKSMLGKLIIPPTIEQLVRDSGNSVLDYTATDASHLLDFPLLTRHDPFDRMILAQAVSRKYTLVTADEVLLGLDEKYILNARR